MGEGVLKRRQAKQNYLACLHVCCPYKRPTLPIASASIYPTSPSLKMRHIHPSFKKSLNTAMGRAMAPQFPENIQRNCPLCSLYDAEKTFGTSRFWFFNCMPLIISSQHFKALNTLCKANRI